MPRFDVQDPKTGKTVTVEGAKAPTQADAEGIFQKAGLRSQEQSFPEQVARAVVPNVTSSLTAPFDPNSEMNVNAAKRPQADPNSTYLERVPQAIQNAAGATVDLAKTAIPGGIEAGIMIGAPLSRSLTGAGLAKSLPRTAANIASKTPGMVKTVLNRAGAGFEQGGALSAIQGGDVVGGGAATAALNLLLPGLSRLTQTTAFKGAMGKSLGALEKFEKQTGLKVTSMNRGGIKAQLKNMQSGLARQLETLVDEGRTMTKKEVFDFLDSFLDQSTANSRKVPPSQHGVVSEYIHLLKKALDETGKSFKKASDNPAKFIAGTEDDALGPFYNLMRKLEGDIPEGFWNKLINMQDPGAKGREKIAAELRGFLRKELSNRSADPKEFEKIMRMKKDVGGMQADVVDQGLMKSAKQLLNKVGIPLGAGIPGAMAIPGLAPVIGGTGAFMAIAERYPQIAPMLRNLLDNPKTAALGDTMIKVLGSQDN